VKQCDSLPKSRDVSCPGLSASKNEMHLTDQISLVEDSASYSRIGEPGPEEASQNGSEEASLSKSC